MHNDNLSYVETFDEALRGLLKKFASKIPSDEAAIAEKISFEVLVQKANDAFEDYLRLSGEKKL